MQAIFVGVFLLGNLLFANSYRKFINKCLDQQASGGQHFKKTVKDEDVEKREDDKLLRRGEKNEAFRVKHNVLVN